MKYSGKKLLFSLEERSGTMQLTNQESWKISEKIRMNGSRNS